MPVGAGWKPMSNLEADKTLDGYLIWLSHHMHSQHMSTIFCNMRWQKDWSVYAQRCIVRCILVNPWNPQFRSFQDMSNPCYTLSFDGKQLALATYSHHFSNHLPWPCAARRHFLAAAVLMSPWRLWGPAALVQQKWWVFTLEKWCLEAIRNAGIYQMIDLFTKNHAFWNAKHGFYMFFQHKYTRIRFQRPKCGCKQEMSGFEHNTWHHVAGCVPKFGWSWIDGLKGKPTGCSRKRRRPHPKLVQSFLLFEWDHHFSWINQLRSI